MARKDECEKFVTIFEETESNEKEHVKLWFKELHGGEAVATVENLKEASASENYEWA